MLKFRQGEFPVHHRLVGFALTLLVTAWPGPSMAQQAVYVVRHAHRTSQDLDEEGRAQAEKLASLLKDSGITAIYTSDIDRTSRTAAPLKALLMSQGVTVREKPIALGVPLLSDPENSALQDDYGNRVVADIRA